MTTCVYKQIRPLSRDILESVIKRLPWKRQAHMGILMQSWFVRLCHLHILWLRPRPREWQPIRIQNEQRLPMKLGLHFAVTMLEKWAVRFDWMVYMWDSSNILAGRMPASRVNIRSPLQFTPWFNGHKLRLCRRAVTCRFHWSRGHHWNGSANHWSVQEYEIIPDGM